MMVSLDDVRNIKIAEECDVIVVGGGIAGVAAAVTASRNGAKTLLLEKQINLGGLATVGLINWYEPLCDGEGNQISTGIAEELLRLSIRYGFEDLPAKWGGEGKNRSYTDRFATHFSPFIFSLALDEYVKNNGVDIRFDTLATYPVMENNICKGIVTETVSGKEYYPAKVVIDATGTAVIADAAGIPTVIGENYYTYVAHGIDSSSIENYCISKDYNKLHKWYSCGSDLHGNGNFEGKSTTHGVTSDEVNDFVQLGKKHLFERIKNDDKNSRDITALSTMPHYRKIKHIVGDYTFTAENDLSNISDSIGKCGNFLKAGEKFKLPYRILYNGKFPNILTAGRIVSAEGKGWEVARVIPVCAVTGEAAGAAASVCVKNGCDLCEVDIVELQQILRGMNVEL